MRVERIQSNSRSLLRSCALFVKVDVKGDTSFHIGLTGFYGRMQANDTSSPAYKHVQLWSTRILVYFHKNRERTFLATLSRYKRSKTTKN